MIPRYQCNWQFHLIDEHPDVLLEKPEASLQLTNNEGVARTMLKKKTAQTQGNVKTVELLSRFFWTKERAELVVAFKEERKESKRAAAESAKVKNKEKKRKRDESKEGKKEAVVKRKKKCPTSSPTVSSALPSSPITTDTDTEDMEEDNDENKADDKKVEDTERKVSSSLNPDNDPLRNCSVSLEQFPDTPKDLPLIRIQHIWKGDKQAFEFIQKTATELLESKVGWKPIMGGHMKNVETQMKGLILRVQLAVAKLQGLENPGFTPVTLIKLLMDQVCFHF
jgi:hypothetical protein